MKKSALVIGLLLSISCVKAQTYTITTVAGNGVRSFKGDGKAACYSELADPCSIVVDTKDNIYIADEGNSRIRKIDSKGIISTIAGGGNTDSSDGQQATSAKLEQPESIAIDKFGNLYIADFGGSCVRKVDTNGIITTIAGTGKFGYSTDGGLAIKAQLNGPTSVAVDLAGNVYVTDQTDRIRKINRKGIITTVAGNGSHGYSGDGGMATKATLSYPIVMAMFKGELYIADEGNDRIRKVDYKGIITTVAGNGIRSYGGDGGYADSAEVDFPVAGDLDTAGDIFIVDFNNCCIRKVDKKGIITKIAGTGTKGYKGDGGLATLADLSNPLQLAIDSKGNVYIADANNNRIRKLTPRKGVRINIHKTN